MAPDEAIKEADEATREAEAGPEETLEAELSAELDDWIGQHEAAEEAEQQEAAAARRDRDTWRRRASGGIVHRVHRGQGAGGGGGRAAGGGRGRAGGRSRVGGTRGGDGGRAVKAAMEAVNRRSLRLEAIALPDSRGAEDQFMIFDPGGRVCE